MREYGIFKQQFERGLSEPGDSDDIPDLPGLEPGSGAMCRTLGEMFGILSPGEARRGWAAIRSEISVMTRLPRK